MTFSLVGRCADTGMFGVVVTSSSVCVASRCAWARAGVGAAATQNITDPRLGKLGLDLLQQGHGAASAMAQMVAAGRFAPYRQLTIVDADGAVAHHSGAKTLGTHAVATGDGCVAAGNLLSSERVPEAMVGAFLGAAGQHMADRLLAAVEAGLAAGGEVGPVRSVGMTVVDRWPWPIVDLRVDWHEEPIAELRRVWDVYRPQMADYLTRALNPSAAPSYGVPGDR
jgi:uncharacterized Ntn-hydrolase superfamily protein